MLAQWNDAHAVRFRGSWSVPCPTWVGQPRHIWPWGLWGEPIDGYSRGEMYRQLERALSDLGRAAPFASGSWPMEGGPMEDTQVVPRNSRMGRLRRTVRLPGPAEVWDSGWALEASTVG